MFRELKRPTTDKSVIKLLVYFQEARSVEGAKTADHR